MAKRERRPRYDPIEWVAAIALAVGSVGAYVIWNTTFLWWVAPLGTFPFLYMVQESARARGWKPGRSQHFDSPGSGPYTPPDGL